MLEHQVYFLKTDLKNNYASFEKKNLFHDVAVHLPGEKNAFVFPCFHEILFLTHKWRTNIYLYPSILALLETVFPVSCKLSNDTGKHKQIHNKPNFFSIFKFITYISSDSDNHILDL